MLPFLKLPLAKTRDVSRARASVGALMTLEQAWGHLETAEEQEELISRLDKDFETLLHTMQDHAADIALKIGNAQWRQFDDERFEWTDKFDQSKSVVNTLKPQLLHAINTYTPTNRDGSANLNTGSETFEINEDTVRIFQYHLDRLQRADEAAARLFAQVNEWLPLIDRKDVVAIVRAQ